MLVKIVGTIWIIMGIIALIWPGYLQKRLGRQSVRKVKKYLFALAVILGVLLIAAAWGHPGWWPKVLVILGIIAIIKGLFFLKGQAAEKMLEWFGRQSLGFFRFAAIVYIILGILIIYGLR